MKIVHRITLRVTPDIAREFNISGFDLREGLTTFEIEESDPRWPSVSELVMKYRGADVPTTIFTRKEIDDARGAKLNPSWHHGYPEPSEDFGYLDLTYDITNYCATCGIGRVQKAPFRMLSEPRWGRRKIFQLNWIFDEFFVPPNVWNSVFRPLGIDVKPVLHAASNKMLSTVVQLDIPVGASALLQGYPKATCIACNREKYEPIARGFFPAVKMNSSTNAVKTAEYFGSGCSAAQAVIVSSTLLTAIRVARIEGVDFAPVAELT